VVGWLQRLRNAGYCDATAIAAPERRGCIAWRIRRFCPKAQLCCVSPHESGEWFEVRFNRFSM
ncbi:hypothetical protein, partial [Xanthomonas citri]|uniref:hypothetical protein n=1 Tax=Xanthomonas citri TaxID=346 RepID=UPI001E5382B6